MFHIEWHKSSDDEYIMMPIISSEEIKRVAHNPHHNVPGLNVHVAPYHNATRYAYSLWWETGKPINGPHLM